MGASISASGAGGLGSAGEGAASSTGKRTGLEESDSNQSTIDRHSKSSAGI